MNLDKYGLPVQKNGDARDQLQRCGMIVAALQMKVSFRQSPITIDECDLFVACRRAIEETHQVRPGIYTRFIGGDPANVSADQLIGALAAHVALGNTKQIVWMFLRMCMRLGFAQNYKDGLDDQKKNKIKLPDILVVRSLCLYLRSSRVFYPFALVADVLLVFAAIAAVGQVWRDDKWFSKRGPDDVDDNNTILTLAVCRFKMVTPLSWLATRIYGRLRPWNYGCRLHSENVSNPDHEADAYHPVYGSLRWYHRAENGGNPEIAEMYREICRRYFE